jgi:DNA-binding NarL/FixJ family response regulator
LSRSRRRDWIGVAMISSDGQPRPEPVRVLVVEDHPVVREGLAGLLEREGGFVLAGQAASAREARALAMATGANVIVLDLGLDDEDGLALIKELAALAPSARVLVFSLQPEEVYAERALRAGAFGYVMKQEPLPILYAAIRSVANGGIHLSPRITAAVLGRVRSAGARSADATESGLTDRELQVYRLTGLALPTRTIAEKLGVSVKTIEAHRENIKNKLGLETHAALVARAAQWVSAAPRA